MSTEAGRAEPKREADAPARRHPPGDRTNAPRAAPRTNLTTFREGSLHAALKAAYCGTDGIAETAVDGFVVDVLLPDGVVEVQTASFASARRKLVSLVERHRVLLVHPIAIEKWLVRVDADGAVLGRRRSPRRGSPLELFDQLVSLADLVAIPNFEIDLVLTREEEVRTALPPGTRRRYPKTWTRLDRRLLEVVETRRIAAPPDLLALLPALPDPFTTADLASPGPVPKRLCGRIAYSLQRAGVTRAVGRRGRRLAYELVSRTPDCAVSPP